MLDRLADPDARPHHDVDRLGTSEQLKRHGGEGKTVVAAGDAERFG
jgi:hypothetical protein